MRTRADKWRHEYRSGSSVLREAMAEGPVFLGDLDKAHEHVLRSDAGAFLEQFRDPLAALSAAYKSAVRGYPNRRRGAVSRRPTFQPS
jgi:hypothetical protein